MRDFRVESSSQKLSVTEIPPHEDIRRADAVVGGKEVKAAFVLVFVAGLSKHCVSKHKVADATQKRCLISSDEGIVVYRRTGNAAAGASQLFG